MCDVWTKEKRGDGASIWEVRVGDLQVLEEGTHLAGPSLEGGSDTAGRVSG